jgi:hypothetical protein
MVLCDNDGLDVTHLHTKWAEAQAQIKAQEEEEQKQRAAAREAKAAAQSKKRKEREESEAAKEGSGAAGGAGGAAGGPHAQSLTAWCTARGWDAPSFKMATKPEEGSMGWSVSFSQKGVAGVTLPCKLFHSSPVAAKEAAAEAALAKMSKLFSS